MNMMLNGDKFQVLRCGCTKDSSYHEYKAPNGGSIPVHDHMKNIGDWMFSNSTFEHHINDVAPKMSGWVLRASHSRSPTLLVSLS